MTNQVRVIRSERIWLKPSDCLSKHCHLSKNLFNEANYIARQAYISEKQWKRSNQLQQELQSSLNYQGLPQPTAQKILQLLERAWKSFFQALADWKTQPAKYFQRPRLPKYKKKEGEFLLPFGKHQFMFQKGLITIPKIGLKVKTRLHSSTNLLGVRIIPKGTGYILEILHLKNIPTIPKSDPNHVVGIDIGLTNLITMVNNIGKKPIIIKGGVAKSINQYYNKERTRLQSIYDRQQIKHGKNLLKLTNKRNKKLSYYFHEVSRFIIDWCVRHKIDTIIIGHNKYWKQHAKLGKRINQNFVLLPFSKLMHMIQYKAMDEGIRVILTTEYYTSKCSFLDGEPITNHSSFQGERITRGLFRSRNGRIVNSDVNAGYNIIKKEVPNAFSAQENANGIEGVWLHPIRWKAKGQPNAC